MKHPLYKNIKRFAKDCKTSTTPWKLWEVKYVGISNWTPLLAMPTWGEGKEYRRIDPKARYQWVFGSRGSPRIFTINAFYSSEKEAREDNPEYEIVQRADWTRI